MIIIANKTVKMNYTLIYIDMVEPRLDEIYHYRALGATKEEIAKILGISMDAQYKLIRKFPEFKKVMAASKKKTIMALEKKVLEKALEQGDNTCLFAALRALAPEVWGEAKKPTQLQAVTIVNDLRDLTGRLTIDDVASTFHYGREDLLDNNSDRVLEVDK